MRLSGIGRWAGRAFVLAALALGVLALTTPLMGSSSVAQSPVNIQAEFDWT